MVCLNSHAAHAVSPHGAQRTYPRLANSLFYFRRSHRTGHVQPPAWLPPVWALKVFRGELYSERLEAFFRNCHDPQLTGGRNTMQQP